MARFSGNVGYLITVEKIEDGMKTGKWEETYIVKKYYGDIIRNISKWNTTSNLNDDISTNNSISIVADPFACNNFQHIKYVEWMGQNGKYNL